MQHKNADVKKTVKDCSEVESEESAVSQDRGLCIKEDAGKEKNLTTEGTHTEREDILDKSKKEPSAKKTAHSIFSKYKRTFGPAVSHHVVVIYSSLNIFCH